MSASGKGWKARLRPLVRRAVIEGLYWSGATAWARRQLRKENAILVLMFHRVLDAEQRRRTNSEAPMIVAERKFAAMMEYLHRHYRVVDATAPTPAFAGSRLGIALTLDDGWADNYEPVLAAKRQYGHSSTIFLSPALMGLENPFWPERVGELMRGAPEADIKQVVEQLKKCEPLVREQRLQELEARNGAGGKTAPGADRTMTWQQVDEMRREGIGFGAHSQTHEILTSLPGRAEVDRELRESRQDLTARFGENCWVMAYPNGGHSDNVVAWTEAAGYRRAFTVEPGAWTPDTHPLRIPRLNISDARVSFDEEFSPAAFEFSVVFRAFRALRRRRAAEAARVPAPAAAAAPVRVTEGTHVAAGTER